MTATVHHLPIQHHPDTPSVPEFPPGTDPHVEAARHAAPVFRLAGISAGAVRDWAAGSEFPGLFTALAAELEAGSS